MRKLFIYITIVSIFLPSYTSYAFWVWTPKTKKLINPKYAAKDTPEEQFRWAMKFFEEKDFKRAAEEFVRLTTYFKDSDLAADAQYYAGRSYEADGKYYFAFQAYQKTIEVYPFSKRIDEVIEREYIIGNLVYKKHTAKLMGKELMTELDRACEIFQKVKENAPFGEYADKAQFMIGECYKKAEQYNEAKKAFQKLVDEYPKSELVDKARYEVAQTTYLASLRPDYDQELTDEAIKEFKRIANESGTSEITKEAKEAITMLEDKKAESLFNTAKFYEKQKHYKSAIIYYREMLNKYPRSPLKESAAQRVEQVRKLLEEEK